jgi:hypothetical protein
MLRVGSGRSLANGSSTFFIPKQMRRKFSSVGRNASLRPFARPMLPCSADPAFCSRRANFLPSSASDNGSFHRRCRSCYLHLRSQAQGKSQVNHGRCNDRPWTVRALYVHRHLSFQVFRPVLFARVVLAVNWILGAFAVEPSFVLSPAIRNFTSDSHLSPPKFSRRSLTSASSSPGGRPHRSCRR